MMRTPIEIWIRILELYLYDPDIFEPSPSREESLRPKMMASRYRELERRRGSLTLVSKWWRTIASQTFAESVFMTLDHICQGYIEASQIFYIDLENPEQDWLKSFIDRNTYIRTFRLRFTVAATDWDFPRILSTLAPLQNLRHLTIGVEKYMVHPPDLVFSLLSFPRLAVFSIHSRQAFRILAKMVLPVLSELSITIASRYKFEAGPILELLGQHGAKLRVLHLDISNAHHAIGCDAFWRYLPVLEEFGYGPFLDFQPNRSPEPAQNSFPASLTLITDLSEEANLDNLRGGFVSWLLLEARNTKVYRRRSSWDAVGKTMPPSWRNLEYVGDMIPVAWSRKFASVGIRLEDCMGQTWEEYRVGTP